jgi:hypothetical protein
MAFCAAPAMAQSSIQTAFNYNLDEAAAPAAPADDAAATTSSGNGCGCAEEPACGCEQSCGCEPSCGCDNGCCNSCGGGGWGNCLGDCCLGDAWTLQGCLQPCCDKSTTYGGWLSMGYYNKNERLSIADNDGLSFNDFPDHLDLDQAWFYVEKLATADSCCATYGYRYDIMYGVHAHAAQAYGNSGGTWDVTFDNGPYGWAMPQAYGEVGYNDWSFKIGKWFTPVGYEVIPDTGNFFYTHTLTHYNSEPFSHTGVLGTYSGNEDLKLYTGWALGWDTGFDQNQGGNIFVGGFTANVTDDVAFTWMTTAGNLGWYTSGQDGFTQHIVNVNTLSECMTWIVQSDYTNANGSPTDNNFDAETGGLTNYWLYKFNDCWGVGSRLEWWKSNVYVPGDNISYYDVTAGVNYRPHANFVLRPEIRYDWTPAADTVNNAIGTNYNQWSFSVDGVFTF